MRRYRIGFTVGTMASDYPRSMRLGIQNTLEEAGHILIAISDLIPSHWMKDGMDYYRTAFEIAARLDLDAVIVPLGSVTAHLSTEQDDALQLLDSMNPANTIVLERSVPGFRCITKDNAPGMHTCMRHLIETCGLTKIAFISGPQSSQGARERESIYFEEMAAHGLEVTSRMFARGLYNGRCADVVEKLLDDNPDIEAIACAADLIAYTVYEVLRNRKITVGKDIAVTGFDDHVRSAHSDPPLSTVHMTGYDYGCMAAREAIRLCEGQPQQEFNLSSTFVARSSCGESSLSEVERFDALLRQDPLPIDELTALMVRSTLSMAGPRITRNFHAQMKDFLEGVWRAYCHHCERPHDEVMLFSSQDLAMLLKKDFREYISLEGFHTAAITLLEALAKQAPDGDMSWVIGQISYLHMRIARLLTSFTQQGAYGRNEREWQTFHMVDDALREDKDPVTAYRLMMGELDTLGIREADLFLLSEPITFVGADRFALPDRLIPIASLSQGKIRVEENARSIALQSMLDRVLERYDPQAPSCTVGGLVAGNEILGIAALESGTLETNRQLMVLLNLGFCIKHLQLIANEREMNKLLNKNNLLLEHQSQHDELTGLLNRRGFFNRISRELAEHQGQNAAMLYLDLDGLKTINDTFGHDMGDQAIRESAQILRGRISDKGILARLGGDEFIAFVPVATVGGIAQLTEDIHADMRAHNARGAVPYTLSISLGATQFVVDEQTREALDQYLEQADEQLYKMKREHHQSRRFKG